MSRTALIAIGGNSLIRAGERGTIDEQLANAHATARALAAMVARGWRIVITHGNGPQVGAALLRSERAAGEVYTHPLDVCVATTQSEIGYLLQRAMEFELRQIGLTTPVLTVLTQVRVDPSDPAFANPTKPIGPFYNKKEADEKKRRLGWDVVEDSARGWRRVVPSPEPKEVFEQHIIRKLVDDGMIVIACGGGGIPVIEHEGSRVEGSEAVIDKDRASSLLARNLKAERFIISTGVPAVQVHFGKSNAETLSKVDAATLRGHLAAGEFPAGSMGPKIEAALDYLDAIDGEVIITDPEHLREAIAGRAGTRIHR